MVILIMDSKEDFLKDMLEQVIDDQDFFCMIQVKNFCLILFF